MTKTFKEIFPNFSTFQTIMTNSIIPANAKEDVNFFNFLLRRFANREFKWDNDARILSNVEEIYYDVYTNYEKLKEIYESSISNLKNLSAENTAFNFDQSKFGDTANVEDIERFISALTTHNRKNKSNAELYVDLGELEGVYAYVVRKFSILFMPYQKTTETTEETIDLFTADIAVSDSESESISGEAITQNIINTENKNSYTLNNTRFTIIENKVVVLENKTQNLDANGRVINSPVVNNDIADKEYVDNNTSEKLWTELWTGSHLIDNLRVEETYNDGFIFPNNTSKGDYEYKIIYSAEIAGANNGESGSKILTPFTKTNSISLTGSLDLSAEISYIKNTNVSNYLSGLASFHINNDDWIVEFWHISAGTLPIYMREIWIREKQDKEK